MEQSAGQIQLFLLKHIGDALPGVMSRDSFIHPRHEEDIPQPTVEYRCAGKESFSIRLMQGQEPDFIAHAVNVIPQLRFGSTQSIAGQKRPSQL